MEVYFQHHDQGQIRRQVRGLPMGGKCSAELANLYCYAVEAEFIDHLIENNCLDEAKKWFFTWRYIDDLCGFGDRGQSWDQLRYGMDHVDTTDSPYNVQNKSSMTVFLGMKITTNADGIWTSVQPKGVGWKWIPQRFMEYGSCHTHYTKWYMLKGLLIRALTICNNQPDFMKAVIYYTQGLISRGFPASALRRAWRKFMYDKIPAQNTRKVLTEAFDEWLNKQNFSQASSDEEQQRQQRKDATQHQLESFLINGLTTINHILRVTNGNLKTLEDMKQAAASMADLEASIISGFDARHILSLQHKNIHPADILLNVLRSQDNLLVNKWDETSPIQTKILLVASGKAWTAVLQDKQQCWSEFHRRARFPIHNITNFLTHKVKQGTVYTVDSWNMDDPDKKGRPPDDVQPAPGGSFIPSTAGLATPLHENKRRTLNPRCESIAARYVRLFPTPNIRFASTGKAVRQFGKDYNPAHTRGEFAIPAQFKQNPVFHFSNQVRLESQAAATAPSQDLLGILIDSLTPESQAKSSAQISPVRPRNLTAVFSSISAALTLSRTPSRSQGRSQSQESTDMLCTPSRSNSKVSQASRNTTEQATDDTDSPTPQRPRRNTAPTHLYQSSEEAHKEKEKRRRAHQRTPRKNKHTPYDRRNSYKTYKASGTSRSSPQKASQDLLHPNYDGSQ